MKLQYIYIPIRVHENMNNYDEYISIFKLQGSGLDLIEKYVELQQTNLRIHKKKKNAHSSSEILLSICCIFACQKLVSDPEHACQR